MYKKILFLKRGVILMKILIADSDRDLLRSYQKLLQLESYEVRTLFDGTQVVINLSKQQYDLVILNKNIPRINYKEIVRILNDRNIPVIVLLDKKITSGMLIDDVLANSYLSFPFLPYELSDRIKDVMSKHKSKDRIVFEDLSIDIGKYTSIDNIRFTNEEINILNAFIKGENIEVQRIHSYINSLNNKFVINNKIPRIKYITNEGYRLVTENE